MALRFDEAWGHFLAGGDMADDKPFFRFHPGAYERGSFMASERTCQVCRRPSVWLYNASVYVGHGDEAATWENPAAAKAIRKRYADEGDPLAGATPYALVFREVDGTRHVAIMDLD
jgi:hypothetical protein